MLCIFMVNVGSSLYQESYNGCLIVSDGVIEWSLSCIVRQVNISIALGEQLAHLKVTLSASVEECCLSKIIDMVDIDT